MSWLFDWMKSALNWLGFYNKEAKLLFLGLDNAGKTTLLGALSKGRIISAPPTSQPNQEELTLGGITFKAFDLGGHTKGRTLWKDYLIDVDVIVFMVDAADPDRLDESKEVLSELLATEAVAKVPVLVLGNKIDKIREAVSERDLRNALGLHFTTGKTNAQLDEHTRPIELYMCSVVNRQGYAEGFRWVSNYVKGK
eukprot:TRINITY_DN1815_c0_g1_i1.p1 TRINITY_DN1815_c0_g1~~TRINITY_DN1815_c0_g1_i1.p1  ORF type:complete len:229 (-),score=42.70 TRINITY_DN1815_c0_g1_i1:119-706(-)